MQKKIFIQLFLLSIIFIISISFYQFFIRDFDDSAQNITKNSVSNIPSKKGFNQLENISYDTQDLNGNRFSLQSKFAELDEKQSEMVLMSKVNGYIYLKDSELITITSNKALFNNLNFSTNFYGDVSIVYGDHLINSKKLDLFFDKKIVTIFDNVIYKNLNTSLQADKIDIDLITKDAKIYMLNKSKKIKIKNLN